MFIKVILVLLITLFSLGPKFFSIQAVDLSVYLCLTEEEFNERNMDFRFYRDINFLLDIEKLKKKDMYWSNFILQTLDFGYKLSEKILLVYTFDKEKNKNLDNYHYGINLQSDLFGGIIVLSALNLLFYKPKNVKNLHREILDYRILRFYAKYFQPRKIRCRIRKRFEKYRKSLLKLRRKLRIEKNDIFLKNVELRQFSLIENFFKIHNFPVQYQFTIL